MEFHHSELCASMVYDAFFALFLLFSQAANRIQTSSTLLLTSITFRCTVNRSLVSLIIDFILSSTHVFVLANYFVFDINGYIWIIVYISSCA
jgi:hypothetical protein